MRFQKTSKEEVVKPQVPGVDWPLTENTAAQAIRQCSGPVVTELSIIYAEINRLEQERDCYRQGLRDILKHMEIVAPRAPSVIKRIAEEALRRGQEGGNP